MYNNVFGTIKLVDNQLEFHVENIDPLKFSFYFTDYVLEFFVLSDYTLSFASDAKDMHKTLTIRSSHLPDQGYLTDLSLIESERYLQKRPDRLTRNS